MFQTFTRHRIRIARFALLALLLRVLVPQGYMPVAVAGGWYLELCPDGLSSETVETLFGSPVHADQSMDMIASLAMCSGGAPLESVETLFSPSVSAHQSMAIAPDLEQHQTAHSGHSHESVHAQESGHSHESSHSHGLEHCQLGGSYAGSILSVAEEIVVDVTPPLPELIAYVPSALSLKQLRSYNSRAPPAYLL